RADRSNDGAAAASASRAATSTTRPAHRRKRAHPESDEPSAGAISVRVTVAPGCWAVAVVDEASAAEEFVGETEVPVVCPGSKPPAAKPCSPPCPLTLGVGSKITHPAPSNG